MIRLFDIENGKIMPTEHCYAISWMKEVMEKYSGEIAKILPYIFYMSFVGKQNPYFNYPIKDRREVVVKDLDIKFSLDDVVIDNAIKGAIDLYSTPTMRAYTVVRRKLEEILVYLDETRITDGKDGNFKDQTGYIEKYAKYYETLEKLEQKLDEEQNDTKVWGGQELAYDQQ